jgi:hypothetical protein
MTHPSLPPRGIFIPTRIIFHTELPSMVLVTWIKLRSLAWKGWENPPMSLPQLAAHLGIHPARLTRHMAMLQELSTLSYREASGDKITISFPEDSSHMPGTQFINQNNQPKASARMKEQDPAELAAYFPTRILGYLSYENDEEGCLLPTEVKAEPAKNLSNLTLCTEEEPVIILR